MSLRRLPGRNEMSLGILPGRDEVVNAGAENTSGAPQPVLWHCLSSLWHGQGCQDRDVVCRAVEVFLL